MPVFLRIVVNIACLIAIGLIAAGLAWSHRDEMQQEEMLSKTARELKRFDQMVELRAATKDVELNARGWPVTVDPGWFKGQPPMNHMLSLDRAWVEVAPPEHATLTDPVIRVAIGKEASFWYNPYQGVIRARVPMGLSDEDTRKLYNRVNITNVASLFGVEPEIVVASQETPASDDAADEMGEDEGDETPKLRKVNPLMLTDEIVQGAPRVKDKRSSSKAKSTKSSKSTTKASSSKASKSKTTSRQAQR